MILREYLYVDTTAVKGVLAQLDAGIVEAEASTSSESKKTSGGVKGFAEHVQDWGTAGQPPRRWAMRCSPCSRIF